MSHHPLSATADTSVREVMRILFEKDIRHLPIVDGSSLIGIVSIRDLPAVVASGVCYFGDPHEVEHVLDQPVSNVMTSSVISVRPTSGLGAAVDLMLAHKVGALPVVGADGRTLIGILSYTDALRVVRPLLKD
ncbi:MAG: CBS domain-containing protein [Polyangiaceae bacterium]